MRYCPFCSAENLDEAVVCAKCARRLPPLPPRRRRPSTAPPVVQEPLAVWPAPSVPDSDGPADEPRSVTAMEVPQPTALENSGSASIPTSTPEPELVAVATPSSTVEVPNLAVVPVAPGSGLVPAVRYTVAFLRSRWQRRGAIRMFAEQIEKDTILVDRIYSTLGKQAHARGVKIPALASEDQALGEAETRRTQADHQCAELGNQQAMELRTFSQGQEEWQARLVDAETNLDRAQAELSELDGQRKDLRDKRKELERRHKAYAKAAAERTSELEKQTSLEHRTVLKKSADGFRQDADALKSEGDEVEHKLQVLEGPTAKVIAQIEALKHEVEVSKRGLATLREGHRQRMQELNAQQQRKTRELSQAEMEIERRLVSLGALVHAHRIDEAGSYEAFAQIDQLKGAIAQRSTQIDRLTSEQGAFDRNVLLRGTAVVLGTAALVVVLVSLTC